MDLDILEVFKTRMGVANFQFHLLKEDVVKENLALAMIDVKYLIETLQNLEKDLLKDYNKQDGGIDVN